MTDRSDRAGGDGLREALDWLINCVECEVNVPGTTTVFQLRLAKAKEALRASPPSGNAGALEHATMCLACGESLFDDDRGCDLAECLHKAASPPQPAPEAEREASIQRNVTLAFSDGEYLGRHAHQMTPKEVIALRTKCIKERTDCILSAPAQSVRTEAPAQSSPCLRYVNDDDELVCKCVNGKYPEVVDMESNPPTCKAAASHDEKSPR